MKTDSVKFECRRCGNCCRVPGYVHLTQSEIDACAEYLKMGAGEFIEKYTRLTKYRTGLSLLERQDGSCIFLSEGGECLIEPVKPLQCRQFPAIWKYDDMEEVCAGWNNSE
jgi:Fe-S-cluster containining protein